MNEHVEIYLLMYLGFLVLFVLILIFVNNRWPNFLDDDSNNQDPPFIPPA